MMISLWEEGDVMPYQIPKADHPWRRYVQKTNEGVGSEKVDNHKKPVGTLVRELGESWGNIEVRTTTGSIRYITELSQYQQASWIIDFIRRNYVRQT
jgi:hypothetical protein